MTRYGTFATEAAEALEQRIREQKIAVRLARGRHGAVATAERELVKLRATQLRLELAA